MFDEILSGALYVCGCLLGLAVGAVLVGIAVCFLIALFVIPVWIVCWFLGAALEWKWVALEALIIAGGGAIFGNAEP